MAWRGVAGPLPKCYRALTLKINRLHHFRVMHIDARQCGFQRVSGLFEQREGLVVIGDHSLES